MEKQKKSKSEWFFVPHFEDNLPHEEEHSKESDFYLFFGLSLKFQHLDGEGVLF